MAEVSRTARVIQNAKVALFFYCINLILQFFSRKIFLDYLGAELLGLNTTAQSLIQFLNLAESGIATAVAFALYKPLSKGNQQEVIDIVSIQGWLYRRIAFVVIVGAVILMCFFPWIFAKAHVPLIYAYLTFIAFMVSALLGYFVNYRMVVLTADQKEYKITFCTQGIKVVKVTVQMWAISHLSDGYLWWVSMEFISAFITSVCLSYYLKQEYPWLVTQTPKVDQLKVTHAPILKKIKQMFFHKISSFVLAQSTSLIIFAFTSLTMVAIYGNYLIILGGCQMFVEALFKGVNASVGNLVAESNSKMVKNVFWKILTLKLFCAGGICSGFFFLSSSFVTLWVGQEYVMSIMPLGIMTCVYFIQMSRTCDSFLWAYGMFKDVYASLIEVFLNVLLSIIFGYFWSLSGIFLGILISQIIIVNSWKAYFLFKTCFEENVGEYIVEYTKKIFLLITGFLMMYLFFKNYQVNITDFSDWFYFAMLTVFLYVAISTVLFTIFDSIFYSMMRQIISYIQRNAIN